MKNLTVKLSWQVLSDVNNVLTVAFSLDDELSFISAFQKPDKPLNQVFLD